jgi:DNA-binding response OmpR family regulator
MMTELNILIIEDESLLALDLATIVSAYGYKHVDYVTTLEQAQKALSSHDVNLILMDINLNDTMDGIDFYKSLNTQAKVIYITAYMDDKTISKAIETDPLGYLAKPHNENELQALLKLAEFKLNPIQMKDSRVKLSSDYSFDTNTNMLFHKNNFVKLSHKKTELLRLLIDAKGAVVSFKAIEDELYKENPPSESTLRTLIYRLRKELDADIIETELNYGVRLKP